MILPNAPVRDYVWTLTSSATRFGPLQDAGVLYSQFDPFLMQSVLSIGAGSRNVPTPNPMFPLFGASVSRRLWWALPNLQFQSHRIEFTVLGGVGYDSLTISTFPADVEVRLEVDDVDFNVEENESGTICFQPWTLTCSGYRFYVDDVLVLNRTGMPYSTSGDYYNPLINMSHWASSITNRVNVTTPSCCYPFNNPCLPGDIQFCNGVDFPTNPFRNITRFFSAEVKTGGSYHSIEGVATVNPAVQQFNFPAFTPADPNCVDEDGCDCEEALPACAAASSPGLVVETEARFQFSMNSTLEEIRHGPTTSTFPSVFHRVWNGWRVLRSHIWKTSSIGVVDKDESFNRSSTKSVHALCNCSNDPPETLTLSGIDPKAYCTEVAEVQRIDVNKLCWCTSSEPGEGGDAPAPSGHEERQCNYRYVNSLTWGPPVCEREEEEEKDWVDSTRDHDGNYWIVYQTQDNIRVERHLQRGTVETFTVSGNETHRHPSIFWSPKDGLTVCFDDDENGYYTRSVDLGQTWSTPVSFADGTHVESCCDEANGIEYYAVFEDPMWKLYRLLPEDEGGDPVYVDDITSAVGAGSVGLHLNVRSRNEIIFSGSDGTDIRRWQSLRAGEDWSEI